jgi:hypothetical protein
VPSRGTVVFAARLLAPPLRRPGHAVAAAATRAERVIPHDCDCTRTQGSAHRKQYPAPPPPDRAQGGWWRQRWPARISRRSNPSTTVGSALTKKIQGARPGEPVQGGRRDGAPPPPPYLQDQALPSRSRPAAAHPPLV